MDERFPRQARITRGWEFLQIKNAANSQRGRFVIFSYDKSTEPVPARAGIIVSKRVGGAVVRNKVRRRLREIARKVRLELIPGLRLVVIARPAAAEASFAELREDWLRSAKRLAIFATPK